MATGIVVPDAGQTTDEMLLVKWYVQAGDVVKVGDILADIETDKAVAELEAYVAGTVLALLAEEGDTVLTGQTLIWIGAPGEAVPEAEATAPAAPEASGSGFQPRQEAGGAAAPALAGHVLASPAARTEARRLGVDLAALGGSGPDGCVVKRDVLATGEGGEGGTWEPLSPMRRAVAARLQQSVREAPHFYVSMDVDMTQALQARELCEPRASVNDVLVKAAAGALVEVRGLNCRLEGERIHYLAEVNVGIAVSVEGGLVVPVLARADMLGLAEIAAESRRLVASARDGRLAAGPRGTFTLSNLGMYGVKSFTAIINPPEAGILAVGGLEDRLVLREGAVVAVPTLTLTLSSDHRLVDGALAAQFLQAVRTRLEAPAQAQL
jgi:pyruvate dehydrogenase E2 component (dihydrolipoamide acetyltransferase)